MFPLSTIISRSFCQLLLLIWLLRLCSRKVRWLSHPSSCHNLSTRSRASSAPAHRQSRDPASVASRQPSNIASRPESTPGRTRSWSCPSTAWSTHSDKRGVFLLDLPGVLGEERRYEEHQELPQQEQVVPDFVQETWVLEVSDHIF